MRACCCVLLILMVASQICLCGEAKDTKTEKPADVIRRVYAAMNAAEEKGFERLGSVKSGTWRAENEEPPETVQQYRESTRIIPTPERYAIVLQPLEPLEAGRKVQVEALREFVEAFFQLPTRIAEPLNVEADAKKLKLVRFIKADRYKSRIQFDAGKILDDLLFEKIPNEAVIYVGLTNLDLFYDGLGVLGLASLQGRVAVCSFYKFADKPWRDGMVKPEELKNFCRLLSHEIGHTFSLGHCVFYRCAMNGCNSVLESESAPLYYCPVCREKLALNNAIDPVKRLRALENFYSRHGLREEASWVRQQLNLKGD
jgi:archaemetzincin